MCLHDILKPKSLEEITNKILNSNEDFTNKTFLKTLYEDEADNYKKAINALQIISWFDIFKEVEILIIGRACGIFYNLEQVHSALILIEIGGYYDKIEIFESRMTKTQYDNENYIYQLKYSYNGNTPNFLLDHWEKVIKHFNSLKKIRCQYNSFPFF